MLLRNIWIIYWTPTLNMCILLKNDRPDSMAPFNDGYVMFASSKNLEPWAGALLPASNFAKLATLTFFFTINVKPTEKSYGLYTGVEFKQKLQLASRTSRYKNQLAPPDILLAIMRTITKNYIIIILFEKIIMKKF